MNKNTILAIVLSTIVVIISITLQSYLMQKASPQEEVTAEKEEESIESKESIEENSEESKVKEANNATYIEGNEKNIEKEEEKKESEEQEKVAESEEEAPKDSDIKEEKITIKTNTAIITLTNYGGDIVSYRLDEHEHYDTDTGMGIEMCDNVWANNRACGMSIGDLDAPITSSPYSYKVEESGGRQVVLFTREEGGIIYGKRYTFLQDEYLFMLELLFHNKREDEREVVYTLRTPPQIGPHFDPKVNKYENRQFISFDGQKAKKINISSSKQYKLYNKNFLWQGIAGKYFIALIIPKVADNMDYSRYSTLIQNNNYANAQCIMTRTPFTLKSSDVEDTYYIYYGPRNEQSLKLYNEKEKNALGLQNKRLNEALQSSGWLGWLETILKWMLEFINKFARNWGVSIILLTIIIKLLMFPMTRKQSLSTLKMQEIQPAMQELQAKYKDNPQKLQEEMQKIYKKEGYNPASGCLPMLLQFLILFAMYNLFNNYFEFRGKGFIPHWIPDLTVGDSVYTFTKNIPFFGNQLRILPIIYLISQLLFGKITGNGGTAAPSSTKLQMNLMMYGMPIIFFFLFYNAPSGLLLYWTVSNIFQMVQQIIINRTLNDKRRELERKKKLQVVTGKKRK